MLKIGDFEIHWLNGGYFRLDAGTMFGVVPKVLWEKQFKCDRDNHVLLCNDVMLVKTPAGNVVIETGIGNKLTEKQKKIFQVTKDWDLPDELERVGLNRNDITHVILTHCDFDHAGGIVMHNKEGDLKLTFPQARHYIQKKEWEDVQKPNKRSASSYWPQNFEHLQKSTNLALINGEFEILEGITVQLTGGHTRGHQAVWLQSKKDKAVHMGDLLPDHGHFNPLWITPYDNFPLDSIDQKEKMYEKMFAGRMWVLFYHDPYMAACRFSRDGKILQKHVEP